MWDQGEHEPHAPFVILGILSIYHVVKKKTHNNISKWFKCHTCSHDFWWMLANFGTLFFSNGILKNKYAYLFLERGRGIDLLPPVPTPNVDQTYNLDMWLDWELNPWPWTDSVQDNTPANWARPARDGTLNSHQVQSSYESDPNGLKYFRHELTDTHQIKNGPVK